MPKKKTPRTCPKCGRLDIDTVCSTPTVLSYGYRLKRYHCQSCDHRWYAAQPPEMIIDNDKVSWKRRLGPGRNRPRLLLWPVASGH